MARRLHGARRARRDDPLPLRARVFHRAPPGARSGKRLASGPLPHRPPPSLLRDTEPAALKAAADRLRALGARITDGPREFPEYRPGYHALFFEDPDGIKLELVWTPPGTYDYQRSPEGSGQPG